MDFVSLLAVAFSLNFCFCTLTDAVLSPVSMWPLTNISFAWEAINDKDAEFPDKKKCPVSLEVGPPQYDFLAFLFDGSSESYVRVRAPSKEDSAYARVSLVFLLYLDSLTSGLVLEFQSTDDDEGVAITSPLPSSESIDCLTLELDAGRPRAKVWSDSNTLVNSLTSDLPVTPQTWTWVAVTWDGDNGVLSVQVGSVKKEKAMDSGSSSSMPMQVAVEGVLQVGHFIQKGAHVSFHGRLCCLGFFGSIVNVGTSEADLYDLFQSSNWRARAPEVKKNCAVGPTYTGPPIAHLWPLSSASFGYDVINDVPPLSPSDYQCLRSDNECEITGRPVVYFDGSQLSYIDVAISDSMLKESLMSMYLFLRPEDPAEGMVWDYRISPGQSGAGFNRMTLTLEDGFPTIKVYDENGECGGVVNRERLLPYTWSMLYLTFHMAVSKMVMFTITAGVLTPSISGVLACSAVTTMPNTLGTLTIGSPSSLALEMGTSDAGFHGNLACLAVVDGYFERAAAFVLLQTQCMSRDAPNPEENTGECDVTLPMRERKFIKAADHRSPQNQNFLECPSARSLIACSQRCRNNALCRAFAYDRSAITEQCCLYDYVTSAGLAVDAESRYFVVSRT